MATNDKVAAAKKQAQAQVNAQQRRMAVMWIIAGVVLVGLFAALVAFIVRENQISGPTAEGQLEATVASDNGGFGFAAAGLNEGLGEAPVRVDVYLDFMCPYCGIFELSQSETLNELRAEGLIDLYYHPISFLDRFSNGTQYSTRAASAAVLIAEEAPEAYLAFLQGMFENQPAEGTNGLNDSQIQEIATAAGVPADVVAKIPDYAYADWVTATTDKASGEDNITFTPALVVNGVLQDTQSNPDAINWSVEGALEAGLRAAAENG